MLADLGRIAGRLGCDVTCSFLLVIAAILPVMGSSLLDNIS